MSSADPDDHEASNPGFFMKSTVKTICLKYPSVKNISTTTLAKWLKAPEERTVVMLDSRPEEEYAVSHLGGAERVNYEEKDMDKIIKTFETKCEGKPNPTVVCYCAVGYRSSIVAKNLQEYYQTTGKKPVPEIYNLSGSIFQWANERRSMVDANGRPTVYAHPYSGFWGKLLDAQLRKTEV